MRNRFKKIIIYILSLFIVFAAQLPVYASAPYKNYVPSYHQYTLEGPQAYVPVLNHKIEYDNLEMLPAYTDMKKDDKNNLYIVDRANSCVVVLDEELNRIKEVSEFDYNNKRDIFFEPEGIFIDSGNKIYVADTKNSRIISFDDEFNVLNVFEAPESDLFSDDYVYQPIRIAVDKSGRIYVISRNETRGLIELDRYGEFTSFFGASLVTPSIYEILSKRFASREMRERMISFVPTEYNSVKVDSSGFVMVTTDSLEPELILNAVQSRSSGQRGAPVRKLNMTGVDVMRRNGYRPPVGDVSFELYSTVTSVNGPSRLTDVVLHDYGIYSVLDNKRGRVFTYDANGNMLYSFGTIGDYLGATRNPVAMEIADPYIYLLDTRYGSITKYEMTNYAKLIHRLIESNYNGEYDKVINLSEEIIKLNSNSDFAYNSIAKAYYSQENYTQAYRYARLSNDRLLASKAFKYIRKDRMSGFIAPIIFVILIIILSVFIYNGYKGLMKQKKLYTNGGNIL